MLSRPMLSWRIGLTLLVALMLTAGCASSEGSSTDNAVAATSARTEAPAADSAEADNEGAADDGDGRTETDRTDDDPTINEESESPIFDALGIDPADQTEATNNYIRAAEALVRECMAEAGFDYIPNEPAFSQSFQQRIALEDAISRAQFIEEYGYGISTLFELDFNEAGVLAFVETLLGPPPTEARSGSEQAAYELALNGETIQGLDAEQAQEQAFDFGGQAADGSCRSYGYTNAENPQGEIFDGLQSLLGNELDQLGDRFESDPRITAMRAAWQTCMAALGYAFERSEDLQAQIQTDANSIGERFQQSPEALALFAQAIEANLASMDETARFEFLEQAGAFQGFSMVPGLQEELDVLIDYELAAAKSDDECTDTDLVTRVGIEVQQRFVEQHADQLALIAAGEAG